MGTRATRPSGFLGGGHPQWPHSNVSWLSLAPSSKRCGALRRARPAWHCPIGYKQPPGREHCYVCDALSIPRSQTKKNVGSRY